jgi:antitoxin component of MazEF toxin-antitoxin module
MNKVDEFRCFGIVKSLLPVRFQKHIRFIYKRGETLFFVLDHPALKTELHYNLPNIKSLLKQIVQTHGCSVLAEVKQLKTFVTNRAPQKATKQRIQSYKERASGNFTVEAKDEAIKSIFERIKERLS